MKLQSFRWFQITLSYYLDTELHKELFCIVNFRITRATKLVRMIRETIRTQSVGFVYELVKLSYVRPYLPEHFS